MLLLYIKFSLSLVKLATRGRCIATICPMTSSHADMQATSVPFFSNASITGTNPSPNKRGLHCLSVSLTDRMDAS
jgi:hypothetical protein